MRLYTTHETKLVLGNTTHRNLPNTALAFFLKSINAVTCTYTHTISYCGKPNEKPTSYYVRGVEKTVKYLVQKLQSYVDLLGYNITFDRLYIPVSRFRSGFFLTTLPVWVLFSRTEEAFLKKLRTSRKECHFPMNATGNQRKINLYYNPT